MRSFVMALLLALPGPAHARIVVGPYLQDARSDGITVCWDSEPPTTGDVIVDGAQHFSSPLGDHHEVRLAGLSSGKHRYEVRAGDGVTAPTDLATAPPLDGDHLDFLVYGDNRDRDADHARVIAAMQREHADLLLQTGDMTGDAGVDALWRRFFTIEEPLLASVPMYPALGNHELLHDPTASHYHHYFALPGPDAIEDVERYYAFRFGNSLFVALDGNQAASRAQSDWLVKTLDGAHSDATLKHVFVFFHQPPFSVGELCGSAAELGLWVPELEEEKVRAVFSGHEHCYEHLERRGVRYFVTGGGGAPLIAQSARCPAWDREALRKFVAVHHFLRVRVRGDSAVLDAIGVGGEILETVRLDEGKPVDPAPLTPVPYREAATRASLLGDEGALPAAPVTGFATRALVLGVAVLLFLGWLAGALIARRSRKARDDRSRRR